MHSIVYTGKVTPPGMRNLQILLQTARDSGQHQLQIVLSSPGGDVDAGFAAFEFINMLDVDVHIHAIGNIASIAMTLLLAGKTRSASPYAHFSTHAARFAEGDSAGQINPWHTGMITAPFRRILKWTDDEIAARFGAMDFNFPAEQAKQLGCVDAVEDRDFHGSSVAHVHIP